MPDSVYSIFPVYSRLESKKEESLPVVFSKLNDATFTLLRFHFYSFLQMKNLLAHIAPYSNENAKKTVSVNFAPAKQGRSLLFKTDQTPN